LLISWYLAIISMIFVRIVLLL